MNSSWDGPDCKNCGRTRARVRNEPDGDLSKMRWIPRRMDRPRRIAEEPEPCCETNPMANCVSRGK
jgi:hypothetical protein